jgi:hypothetical protein
MKFSAGEMVLVVFTAENYARYRGEICIVTEVCALNYPDYKVFFPCDSTYRVGQERCFAKIPPHQEPDAMRVQEECEA